MNLAHTRLAAGAAGCCAYAATASCQKPLPVYVCQGLSWLGLLQSRACKFVPTYVRLCQLDCLPCPLQAPRLLA